MTDWIEEPGAKERFESLNPEPTVGPSADYDAGLPDALRTLAVDADLQHEADLAVGWDWGPEQGAWLRALADAVARVIPSAERDSDV